MTLKINRFRCEAFGCEWHECYIYGPRGKMHPMREEHMDEMESSSSLPRRICGLTRRHHGMSGYDGEDAPPDCPFKLETAVLEDEAKTSS